MIYLDNNATTPIDPEVAEAMLPFVKEHFGNPSSGHKLGQVTKKAIVNARLQVANLIGAKTTEIVFASCATEANNAIVKGVADSYQSKGNHIVTSAIEHPSVLEVCNYLKRCRGFEITELAVDQYGLVDPEDLKKALTDKTILVSIMHANNEVGTLQPITELAKIAREKGALFHTDAAQSVAKVAIDVKELGVDFLTIAGHKLYAPKGVGAFFIREGIEIEPLLHGAGHESARRSGTEDIILVVALGKACEIALNKMSDYAPKLQELRDLLLQQLQERIGEVKLNGHPQKRLPNTASISFPGFLGGDIIAQAGEIAASTGAACHDRSTKMSHVLAAMKTSEETARGTIRFSINKFNTKEEINQTCDAIEKAIAKLK